MKVGHLSYSQLLENLGEADAAYRIEARDGDVTLSVDGIYGALKRAAKQF